MIWIGYYLANPLPCSRGLWMTPKRVSKEELSMKISFQSKGRNQTWSTLDSWHSVNQKLFYCLVQLWFDWTESIVFSLINIHKWDFVDKIKKLSHRKQFTCALWRHCKIIGLMILQCGHIKCLTSNQWDHKKWQLHLLDGGGVSYIHLVFCKIIIDLFLFWNFAFYKLYCVITA